MNEPIKTIHWQLVDTCNYRCEYCSEGRYDPNVNKPMISSDQDIEPILKTIKELPGSWQVKFSFGESTIHPKFADICKQITDMGHTLWITTNFSSNKEKLNNILKKSGKRLETLCASLHLSQTNIDTFIEKAKWFNSVKGNINFIVTMVALESKIDEILAIQKRLRSEGIKNVLQTYQDPKARLTTYSEDVTEKLRKTGAWTNYKKSYFGLNCHAGDLFLVIKMNGDVYRCFEPQPGHYLGNIVKGTFKRNRGKKPCLSLKCTCPTAANRRMIKFNEKRNAFLLTYDLLYNSIRDTKYLRDAIGKRFNIIKRPSNRSKEGLIQIKGLKSKPTEKPLS